MTKEKHSPTKLLYICTGEKCKKRGSKEISKTLRAQVEELGIEDVGIIRTHCTDNCKRGPVVCLQPENTWHFHVDEQKAMVLLKHIVSSGQKKSP